MSDALGRGAAGGAWSRRRGWRPAWRSPSGSTSPEVDGGAAPEERLRLLSEAAMRAMVAASAGNPRAEHILRELGARGEGPQARWRALVEVARGAWEAAHGAEPARVFSTRDEGGTVRPVLNGADGKRYASLGWVGRRCAEFRGTARVVPRHQAVRELMEEEAAWVASQQI